MAGDKALGARIQSARAERGWRQKDLAAALGVEALTVSRWERGEHAPTVETLGRLAGVLGKQPGYFMPAGPPPTRRDTQAEPLVASLAHRLEALEGAFSELSELVAQLADRLAATQRPAHDRAGDDNRAAES